MSVKKEAEEEEEEEDDDDDDGDRVDKEEEEEEKGAVGSQKYEEGGREEAGLETSVRNYSVRTTFKYPARREISKVVAPAQEDGGQGGKTGGQKKRGRVERGEGGTGGMGRVGYNSVGGRPKLVSRSAMGNLRAREQERERACFAR